MNSTTKDQLNTLAQRMLDGGVGVSIKNESNATQLVMGDGNPDADVVFIGEAPGEKEDIQGRPFVGAAGKLLSTLLESVGMERSDVYITNIVKYRPLDNRDPSTAEKAEFWPYLEEELRIVNPKLIITLGRHSMNNFLPDAKISTIHGQLQRITFDSRELGLLPLFHPAYALFNGGARQTLFDDFQNVPKAIEQLD